MLLKGRYRKFDVIKIEKNEWHKLENHSSIPLKIIEIQYGQACDEEDIERI
jgi:mannose-6-phosphate isomerase-like protein (cupin superfamily)